MLNPWLGIALVLGTLGASLFGLRAYQQTQQPHPEVVRKLLHVVMGLVTLSFPWVFDAWWPVAVLTLLSIGAMGALRYRGLRETAGSVIHGVGRASLGEMCFPLAVLVLFVLAGDEPVLYAIPVLLLGLADPAAALVGLRYGRAHYGTSEGTKSGEGSMGFFVMAFFCTHVLLLLFTETGRLETLLIALIVGFLAMLVEAIAWRGLDNLFVPLGALALLETHLRMTAPALAARLVVVATLFATAVLWRRETTLNGSAVFCAALVGWVTWAVGGWAWLPAPAALYFGYTLLWPDAAAGGNAHTVHDVLSVSAVGLAWLFLAEALRAPALLYPYTLAYAAHLAMIGVERLRTQERTFSALRVWSSSTLKSSTALLLTLVLIEGLGPVVPAYALGVLLAAGLAAWAYDRHTNRFDHYRSAFTVRLVRSLFVAAVSTAGLLVSLALDPL